MSYLFINKNPKSETVWRTSYEDKLTITRYIQQGKPKRRKRARTDDQNGRSSSRLQQGRLPETSFRDVSPSTILNAERIDPFTTYAVSDVTISSQSIIDHAIHKALLKDGPRGLVSEAHRLLELKGKALYYLKQQYATIQSSVPDDVFTTIIALGSHEIHPRALEFAGCRYSESPMAKTQILDLVSVMTFVPAHIDALYTLVAQRGGLGHIHSYGVADTVALADLMFSTVNIVPPKFDCHWRPDVHSTIAGFEIGTGNLRSFGKGFDILDSNLRQRLGDFMDLLLDIRKLTLQIAEYHQTCGQTPNLASILNLRNYVQWHLLSLSSRARSLQSDTIQTFNYAIRIAALIFSDMVIFPLGPALGHRHILANLLKAALERCPRFHLILTLWLLTMGGIAAKHSHCEVWYLKEFRRAAEILCTSSVPFFHVTMADFLWWDVACEDAATDFWIRAFNLCDRLELL